MTPDPATCGILPSTPARASGMEFLSRGEQLLMSCALPPFFSKACF